MRFPSHEQQWLTALKQRVPLSTDETKQLKRLEEGFQGECYLDQLFHLFGPKDIPCLDDVTLSHRNSVVQIDKLFLLDGTLYLLDAKAYHGNYNYDGQKWRGEKIPYNTNIFHQLSRAQTIVENILEEAGLLIPVKSLLVFTENDLTLSIPKELNEKVLQSRELSAWMHTISKQKRKSTNQQLQERCMNTLKKATIPRYRTQRTLTDERSSQLKKGICCEKCHHYTLTLNTYAYTCQNCGHQESREKAYVRTICDYGTIFHEQELTRRDLRSFLGENIKEDYLKSILRKHFQKTEKKSSAASYINDGTPIYEWFKKEKVFFDKTEKRIEWGNKH